MRLSGIFSLLLLAACQHPQPQQSVTTPPVALKWTGGYEWYEIVGFYPDDEDDGIDMEVFGDTVFYIAQPGEPLAGKTIRFNPYTVAHATVTFRVGLKLLQYTIDDHGTTPLPFSRDMGIHSLPVALHQVTIPDYYGNNGLPRMDQILGFASRDSLARWLERTALAEIREQSLQVQRQAYGNLLTHKDVYAACCPEYLAQAQAFMVADPDSFTTLHSLVVETVFTGLVIDLHLALKGGGWKHLVLVSVDDLDLGY